MSWLKLFLISDMITSWLNVCSFTNKKELSNKSLFFNNLESVLTSTLKIRHQIFKYTHFIMHNFGNKKCKKSSSKRLMNKVKVKKRQQASILSWFNFQFIRILSYFSDLLKLWNVTSNIEMISLNYFWVWVFMTMIMVYN